MARLGRPLGRWAACGGAWKEEARGNLRPRALLSRACPLPPRVARPPAAWHRACATPRPAEAQQGPSRVPGLALRRAARAREAISEHTAARQIIRQRGTRKAARAPPQLAPASATSNSTHRGQQHAQRPGRGGRAVGGVAWLAQAWRKSAQRARARPHTPFLPPRVLARPPCVGIVAHEQLAVRDVERWQGGGGQGRRFAGDMPEHGGTLCARGGGSGACSAGGAFRRRRAGVAGGLGQCCCAASDGGCAGGRDGRGGTCRRAERVGGRALQARRGRHQARRARLQAPRCPRTAPSDRAARSIARSGDDGDESLGGVATACRRASDDLPAAA